jgi:exopolyphosphatase/guanosine-5'-triphosphate,3'-diphosphate pyrophosphatase
MDRTFRTLDEYKAVIDHHRPGAAVAVLTSAVRDAANGQEFADAIQDRYGLIPHILTGDEEARLTFLGATSERDPNDATPTVVIDIGGGSTELVIGQGCTVQFHVSTQAGVVRQTERHLHTDPPTADELQELEQDIGQILEAAVPEPHRRTSRHAIAVAGTPTSLAAIAQELEPYNPERVHGYLLTRDEIETLTTQLTALTLVQRRNLKGLHPDRAPTIVAGAVILTEAVKLFEHIHAVEVSEHDILRGAALTYA